MARTKKNEAPRQPTEIGELKSLVDQFMTRYTNLENEIELLKDDQKQLIDEFSDRLHMKTLKQAIRTVKIKKKVEQLETYEAFVEFLDERECI